MIFEKSPLYQPSEYRRNETGKFEPEKTAFKYICCRTIFFWGGGGPQKKKRVNMVKIYWN